MTRDMPPLRRVRPSPMLPRLRRCTKTSPLLVLVVASFVVFFRVRSLMSLDKSHGQTTLFVEESSRQKFIQESRGREPVLAILQAAGIETTSVAEIARLPLWKSIEELYGHDPVIIGLETCEKYRQSVPLKDRFIGISGMFNSGTTAFGFSLQSNCYFPGRAGNKSNSVVTDIDGMLSQVPWARHKDARSRLSHSIVEGIDPTNVLPAVMVRDPYFWMQSMCKEGYGARWDHNSKKHCPNLVPNDFDKRRFKRLANATSVTVWMGKSMELGPNWDSLAHYWNDWYESYYTASFPRLIVRFEDTLFHPIDVMQDVCRCAGAKLRPRHRFYLGKAKWNHKQEQNDMLSAMIRYGKIDGRLRNMTEEDIQFAERTFSRILMNAFHYSGARHHVRRSDV